MGLFNFFNDKLKGKKRNNGLNQSYFRGYLRYEFYRKNGELDGLHKEFFENGNIKKQTNYKNGERIGKLVSFYDNGQIAFETYNKNIFNEYKRDGSVKFKFKDGYYTFFRNNKKKFKISIRLTTAMMVNEGDAGFKELSECLPSGIWTAFRDDESIEYTINFESPISMAATGRGVLCTYEKIIYTKAGEVYSKTAIKEPKLIRESLCKFMPGFYQYRIYANDQIIIPARFKDLRGDFKTYKDNTPFYIDNTPLISIEDIVDLKSTD